MVINKNSITLRVNNLKSGHFFFEANNLTGLLALTKQNKAYTAKKSVVIQLFKQTQKEWDSLKKGGDQKDFETSFKRSASNLSIDEDMEDEELSMGMEMLLREAMSKN